MVNDASWVSVVDVCRGSLVRAQVGARRGTEAILLYRDSARFPPDVMLGIQAKEFNLDFIRPDNLHLVSHGLRVFRCLLANSKQVVCGVASVWPLP